MSHALFLKHYEVHHGVSSVMLAYDIACEEEAKRLARSLASSYPKHGVYARSGVAWFMDGGRLHEIWYQAVR